MDKAWQLATRSGDVAAVRAIPEPLRHLDSRDGHGQTALMNAAAAGHFELVRYLVDEGAELNATAKYGLTALMLAVVNGHGGIALELIGAGADLSPEGTGAPGFAGRTALDLARDLDLADVVAAIEGGGAGRW